MAQREDAVLIPKSLLQTVSSLDELEDWLAAQNPDYIADLRRIRDEEQGKGITLDSLRREWNIPS